jgi:hypothetical protein
MLPVGSKYTWKPADYPSYAAGAEFADSFELKRVGFDVFQWPGR